MTHPTATPTVSVLDLREALAQQFADILFCTEGESHPHLARGRTLADAALAALAPDSQGTGGWRPIAEASQTKGTWIWCLQACAGFGWEPRVAVWTVRGNECGWVENGVIKPDDEEMTFLRPRYFKPLGDLPPYPHTTPSQVAEAPPICQALSTSEYDGMFPAPAASAPGSPDEDDAIARVERLLTNLQPHISQACIEGHEGFIDNYVDPALEILRAALARRSDPAKNAAPAGSAAPATPAERVPANKWGEPDEFPVVGRFHVRHSIPAAADTGYLFGKNFDTLFDAIRFAEKQIHSPRLLVYAGDDMWLKFEPPLNFEYYYVRCSED